MLHALYHVQEAISCLYLSLSDSQILELVHMIGYTSRLTNAEAYHSHDSQVQMFKCHFDMVLLYNSTIRKCLLDDIVKNRTHKVRRY